MASNDHADAPAESPEHEALAAALDAVDAALQRRLQASNPRAMGMLLTDAFTALSAHRAAAENVHGILAEMDVSHGRCECLTRARNDHRSLDIEARELSRMLSMGTAPAAERLEAFAMSVHAHADLLAELRLALFNQDIGVGD
jgi:hypothetical protein